MRHLKAGSISRSQASQGADISRPQAIQARTDSRWHLKAPAVQAQASQGASISRAQASLRRRHFKSASGQGASIQSAGVQAQASQGASISRAQAF
jgi:hypothetical protein